MSNPVFPFNHTRDVLSSVGVVTEYRRTPPLHLPGVLTTTGVSLRMSLVDLSYTFSEADRSIWPGNQPFRKTVVADHSDNCIMASVGPGRDWVDQSEI